MKQTVAIDPGLNACGLAILDQHGFVEHAELVVNPLSAQSDLPARWEAAAVAVGQAVAKATKEPRVMRSVIVEMPRVYPAARQKGDQNDLLNLVGVVASVLALGFYVDRRIVYPRDWKGTLDADEMIERIKGRLFPKEHENVRLPTAKSLQHNVYDAIGIGLFAVGRLQEKRVYPR